MLNFKSSFIASALVVPFLVAGCGGGGSSSGDSSDDKTGSLSIGVTDGPVDSASKVVVSFSGVAIKPADGQALTFTFDTPRSIDLLQLQGSNAASLLSDEEVPAGAYEWIRLDVNASLDGTLDSYIEMSDGTHELWVPSGSQTGLKLVSGFTVLAGGSTDFTIDFDLRKSIVDPAGALQGKLLKPALRLIDNSSAGTVTGMVSSTIVADNCADASSDDGSVYLFAGAGATPQDVQGNNADPLVSALVHFQDGSYSYEIGFLPAGDYTIAYTCESASDDPAQADTLTFIGTSDVSVSENTVTTFNFE